MGTPLRRGRPACLPSWLSHFSFCGPWLRRGWLFAFAFKDLNMSTQITIDLPDDAFSALRSRPEDFVKEMRLAAAVKWLELGLVYSQRLRNLQA